LQAHLGDQKTTIRCPLLVVFSNQAVGRSGTSSRPVPGQGCHNDAVFQLNFANTPWRKEGVDRSGARHHDYEVRHWEPMIVSGIQLVPVPPLLI